MKKLHLYFTFAILISLLILQVPRSVHAQTPAISNGLTWLDSVQSSNGSWGSDVSATDFVPATSAVLESLAVLNSTYSQNYVNAANWLSAQQLDTTRYLAERLTVFPTTGADKDPILVYLDQLSHAWGGYSNFTVSSLDTALALQALKAANYSDTTLIGQSLNYLTTKQNADGGWGLSANDVSNTYITSVVLRTLAAYNSVFINQNSINNAATFLLAKQAQNNNGGFGSSPSTVYDTALSLMSLIESGQGSIQQLQNAVTYLTSAQSTTNGSWNNDPYATALALQALAKVRPNLALSSTGISFSNTMPQAEEQVTITATVNNSGLEAASNIVVRFYLGDPAATLLSISVTTPDPGKLRSQHKIAG